MKEGRWWEGVAERCDHWEFQGKVEVAFSVRDLSERMSGRKALFILASTTFDAVKSIPSAHTVHLQLNNTLRHTPGSLWYICHLFSTSLWGSVRCHLPTVTRWLPL